MNSALVDRDCLSETGSQPIRSASGTDSKADDPHRLESPLLFFAFPEKQVARPKSPGKVLVTVEDLKFLRRDGKKQLRLFLARHMTTRLGFQELDSAIQPMLCPCSPEIDFMSRSRATRTKLIQQKYLGKNFEADLRSVLASVVMAALRAACTLFVVNKYFAPRLALAANSRCSPGQFSVQLESAEARERAYQAGWFHGFADHASR